MSPHPNTTVRTAREINDRIRRQLDELGLSASEAAQRAGIASTTLTRPLNDPDHPFTLSTTTLSKLAAVLKCDPSELIASDDRPANLPDLLGDIQPRGAVIREARVSVGLKQKAVADYCGVTPQAVNQWESGKAVPSLGSWERLKELLGIEFNEHSEAMKLDRLTELRDEIETAYDLLTALDKTGDGIGGDVGHGVSAVALAARSALDNARSMLRAMEGRS